MLVVVAAWALFAFAGVYAWTLVPLGGLSLWLLLAARPHLPSRRTRTLDVALIAAGVVIAAQLLPLPPAVRTMLAPSSVAYDRAARITPAGAGTQSPGPVSIDPAATAIALATVATMLGVFWSARSIFERGGVRTTIRGIAVLGAIVAPLAIAQHVTDPREFYWLWPGPSTNALPYSPFVNRNDFAGWLVLAIPLAVGYAVGRLEARGAGGGAFDPDVAFDNTGALLTTSAFAMSAALLASLSRSGILGGGAGITLFFLLSRRRMSARRSGVMLAGIAATIAVAAVYTNADLFAQRMGNAVSEGIVGRLAIWRQTWPMMRAFWPLGSGVGTYQQAMVLYQTSSHLFYISHADNEYLQMLAEGGAPLAVAAAAVIAAAIRVIWRELAADRSSFFWMRAGAVAGLAGFAVQNVWEMTLRVPANGVLLALVAAIAMRATPETW